MDNSYNPGEIEQSAQAYWDKKQCYAVTEDLNKEKFYCLTMFPYPSGTLHMGHVRCYTIGDVIARFQRALGKNVLQPIGWDAFGLPAENAAIKHKVPPAEWTHKNIAIMREQFKRLGNAYDWKREIATCQPDYYRWEQWFFIKLYEKGLVYKKNTAVNWDPVDKTVLANEQVVDGRGWRSGALIERREISQWFLKITAYADELLDDLDKLDEWPLQVKTMQRNWIGRSEGVEVTFEVQDHKDRLKIYTTRADTLMGMTYLSIASSHPLAKKVAKEDSNIRAFIDECKNIKVSEADMAKMEKKGVDTGLVAIHPISGEKLPIWIANFVLMEYGSGAVMCVPGHDQRDWEFAQKYSLPIKRVILPLDGSTHDLSQSAYTEKGVLTDSGDFNGLHFDEACDVIAGVLEERNQAKKKVHYRLRDWGVSRQRYWGTPIPMILCDTCGAVPVPEDQLPVTLPENVDISGSGSPLQSCAEFVQVDCPKCGQDAERETDTFDTFVESSWYYARFACKQQENAMLDDRANYWTPVDQYVGGIEHAVMHLLYARFFHKLMRDEGLVNSSEPFKRLLTQGMVLKDGSKMSKSKGNTVDPNALIEKYGADTVRFFTIFAAPPEQTLEWSDSGVEGAHRFLKRLWAFASNHQAILNINETLQEGGELDCDWQLASSSIKSQRRDIHTTLKQASYDMQRNQFNTVASSAMKILNVLLKVGSDDPHGHYLCHEGVSILLRLLAPITPHICHHLWRSLAYGKHVIDAPWPKEAKSALKLDEVDYVVQINGKLKGSITIANDADDETIIDAVQHDEKLKQVLAEKTIRKTIVVGHRKLVNIVVA